MSGHERRWAVVSGALQFAAHVHRGISGPESASYVTTGIDGTLELMLRTHGRSPTPLFLLCPLFCDALDLSQETYLDLPRPREWEAVAGRYCLLFAAYAIHPHNILLRLPNQRLYIESHVREYQVGLDAECEERITRWTLEVQSTLEAGDERPPFSTVISTTNSDGNYTVENGRTLESDHLHIEIAEQGGAARSAAERRHTAGNRSASPCAYCGGGTRGIYWRFGDRVFMGTYSVSPQTASAYPLHTRLCETPREWACRPTAMRRVLLGMVCKKSASPSGGAG